MNLFAFSFTRLRQLSIVLALSCLLLLPMYLGGLFDAAHARPLLTPAPVVTLDVPAEVLIGEDFTFQVTFENNGPADDEGYGPFIDLVLPAGGIDLDTAAEPCDGITFVQAEMVGVNNGPLALNPASPSPLTIPPCGSDTSTHPYASGGVSGVTMPAGAQLVTLVLPFGSYEPSQPEIVVEVTAHVHEFADVGDPLTIYARGGFRYGDDPEDNHTVDSPILSHLSGDSAMWASSPTRPTLFTLKKEYLGPENENATGPNFVGYYPLQYEITLDIAAGQTITDVVVTDTLPNNMVFESVDSVSVSPHVVTPPTSTPANFPDNQLVVAFDDPITGDASPDDVVITFSFHIPAEDADGNPILDRGTCEPVQSINDVKATGLWDPLDPRDVGPVTVESDITDEDHILLDKCLAIQKSVTIAEDTGAPGATPGDILMYTLNFQVSDFFTFGELAIDDYLSDGQLLVVGSASLTVSDRFGTTSGTFTIGDDFLRSADPNIQCGIVEGGTHLQFLVSQAMSNLTTFPSPHRHAAGILTGDHAVPLPTTTPATGEIVFYVQIQDEFDFPHPGDEFVDKHDPMNNCVTIRGEVFTNEDAPDTPLPTGVIAQDDSETSISIVHGILSKEVYAVNGDTSLSPPIQVAAGDDITFRITYDAIPSSDAENLVITDWLPQPVLDVDDPDADNTTPGPTWPTTLLPCGALPPAPGDACHLSTPLGIDPALAVAPPGGDNSLTFTYGSFNDPTNTPSTIDILFSLTVTSDPYADGLLMTNEAQECEDNTFAQTFCQVAVAQFEVTQPVLKITKGVVATDNPNGEFVPSPPAPVTFTTPPDNTCLRFTPLDINSGNLPINSDVKFVDAGDWVTFAIVVENTGSGLNGAFDVQIKDVLPPEFINPSNLCVTNGTNLPISTGTLPALLGPGIELDDPGPTITPPGALDPYGATSGNNLAVITFDAQISPTVQVGECLENKAGLLHYAGIENGPDHVQAGFGGPYTDTAKVCILPLAEKSIVTTSEAHTTPDDSASGTPELTIGEIVRYRLQVRLPEGVSPDFALKDNLPADLVYLDDGTATVAFVSDAGIASTAIPAAANVAGDESTVDGITPTNLLPSSQVDGGPFGCATPANDPTFQLGTLTNSDFDSDLEFVVVEFNALVCNTSANNNGNTKANNFTVEINGQVAATSNSVNAKIVEPLLTVSKEVVSGTVEMGGSVVYQITVENTGTATAFDVRIDDPLPICLTDLQVLSISNPTGGAVDIVDSSTGSSLGVSIAELPVGDQVVIEIAVQVECLECDNLENTVNVSYTSLPGENGTVSNPTGSATPGASGDPDGERDGSGGVNDYTTEASAPLCGEICGVKFHDENRNGVQDPGEPTLAGWPIEIRNAANQIVATATTGANGEYCAEVPFGSVTVSEIQQNDWTQIFPAAPGTHTVTVDPAAPLVEDIDFGNATCTPPPADMVAWWSLDEPAGSIAADAAMFNNEGQHVGSPIPVGGMVDGALSFNGINQYVRVPDHSEINFGTGDLSIDAWIKTSSTTNDYQVIVDKRGDTPIGPMGYEFLLYRGKLMFQLAADNGWSSYYNSSSPDLRDGAWHFVAVTVDRDDMAGGKLYVDGTLIHTFNPVKRSGSITNAAELWIGKHHPAGNYPHDRWFKGRIDEVEIFNRALTATEIWDIWLANSDGKCKKPDLEIEKRHVGHFEIGGVGTYVIDVTNVGNGEANGPITVIDTLPSFTTYLSGGGSGWSCPAGPIPAPGPVTCTYTGPPPLPLAPGQTLPPLVINIRLNDLPKVENCAVVETPDDSNADNNESCDVVEPIQPINGADLGDAPDSTNHSGIPMWAYWWWWPKQARYPTVHDTGTGMPPGPMHNNPEDDAFLGLAVSQEKDADLPPDQDPTANITPPGASNQDRYDDGVHLGKLPRCRWTRFKYDVNVVGAAGPRNVNLWFDFNQDGDWEDTTSCKFKWGQWEIEVPVREWAVRNHTVNLTPGYNSNLNTPFFWAKRPTTWWGRWKGMWMRTTLTQAPVPWPASFDGSGPIGGYQYGETEDYRLRFPWWWVLAKRDVQVSTTFTQTNGLVDKLTVPALAVTEPMTVTISPMSNEEVASGQLVHRRFDLEAYSEDGELAENFTFQQPVSLTLHYTDEEARGPALDLLRYDFEEGEWVEAACGDVVDDTDANRLLVPVCRTGELALAGGVPNAVSISAPVIADGTADSQVALPITLQPYTSGVEIDAYDFTLLYDPSVISITGVSQAGTLSEAWSVTSDSTTPGQLVVTGNGDSILADGGGTLINLTTNLTTATGVTTALIFGEVTLNDGDLSVIPEPGILAIEGDGPTPTPTPTATAGSMTPTPTATASMTPTPTATAGSMTPTPTATAGSMTPTPTPTAGSIQITEVTPRYGLNDGPSTIYIYGNGFSESLTVRLGPTQTLDVNFVMTDEEPQRIRAVVPSGVTPGVYDITVETDSGSATKANAYEVLDAGTTDDLLSLSEWMWTNPMPMRVGYANSSVGLLVQHLGGTATLDAVEVEFRLDSPTGEVLGRSLTKPLAPDATDSTGPVIWEPTEPSDPDDEPKDYRVCAIIDPDNAVEETNEDNNLVCQTITVLPPHPTPNPGEPDPDTEPPEVDSFAIDDDVPSTNQRGVKLDVAATDYPLDNASGMNAMKYIEFEYIHGARRWVPIQGQGTWVDYETAQSNYDWDLLPSYGMRYKQAWASDNNRNISLKPGVDVIDLLPEEQEDTVGRNGIIFYRIFLEEGERFAATMTPVSGDPDMYVWLPDASLRHNVNSTGAETVEFEAPFDGTYQIEIHGPSSGSAEYRLTFGASRMAPTPEEPGSNKTIPDEPAVRLDEWPEYYDVGIPPLPDPDEGFKLFLPLVIR